MKRIAQRMFAAWRAMRADSDLRRQRKAFDRNNPHIVAKRREIERKQRRHQATLADQMELRRMMNKVMRGDA